MRKFFSLLSLLCITIFLANCAGDDGSAYQKYWWNTSLVYIYDENPSTPDTIYNDVYYPTETGTYYMEYKTSDRSVWYMYYTITIDEGKMFQDGYDSWFEIALYSTGPKLYKTKYEDYHRSISTIDSSKETSLSVIKADTKISNGKVLSEILGSDEMATVNGSIRIEYGKVFDK